MCGLCSPSETMCQNKGWTPVVRLITAIPYTAIPCLLTSAAGKTSRTTCSRFGGICSPAEVSASHDAATLQSFSPNDYLPSSRAWESVSLRLCPRAKSRNPTFHLKGRNRQLPVISSAGTCSRGPRTHHDVAAIDKYCCPHHAIYMKNQTVGKDGMFGGPVAEVDLMIRRRALFGSGDRPLARNRVQERVEKEADEEKDSLTADCN